MKRTCAGSQWPKSKREREMARNKWQSVTRGSPVLSELSHVWHVRESKDPCPVIYANIYTGQEERNNHVICSWGTLCTTFINLNVNLTLQDNILMARVLLRELLSMPKYLNSDNCKSEKWDLVIEKNVPHESAPCKMSRCTRLQYIFYDVVLFHK